MAPESMFRTMALMLSLFALTPQSRAEDAPSFVPSNASVFRTERLSPRQIKSWNAIRKIALASDRHGQSLHPRLHGLWQRVQSSGHAVFIELTEHRIPTRIAGTTTLQKADSNGNHKVIVIWLHLWAIDNAFVDPVVRRSDGLIPFYRLGQYERYAEVLGHELAHAFLMLENPEYARLSLEYGAAAAELLRVRKQDGNAAGGGEIAQQLLRLSSLEDKIEKPAQAAELEIWRELTAGRKLKL